MIGVLDYGMGNLRSICNAIEETGNDAVLVNSAGALDDLSHLIIPGVGHFRTAMAHLRQRELETVIKAYIDSGRPLLGVCLGMQILAAAGTEGGAGEGLNLIPATVQPLSAGDALRIPHVGWNTVVFHRPHPVADGIKEGCDFYFVHSFAMQCEAADDVVATTEYGADFVSIVGRNNVLGFQFHPEKSQINGLQMLENFCDWDGQC
jgi:imidazole glycerol-phosphate synthase subunit HisH